MDVHLSIVISVSNSYMRACLFLVCMLLSCIYLFNLQMSMNVNWRHIHAVPMPTALTLMAASTAHVGTASKEMGSIVQVYVHLAFLQSLICI